MANELQFYNAAKAALAKAVKADEVKHIHNKASAIKAAAKIAKDKTLEANAQEIRMRAERSLGEMMAQQPKASGGEHGGRKPKDGIRKNPSNAKATLKEAGIDKNLAHAARTSTRALNSDALRRSIGRCRPTFSTSSPNSEITQMGWRQSPGAV